MRVDMKHLASSLNRRRGLRFVTGSGDRDLYFSERNRFVNEGLFGVATDAAHVNSEFAFGHRLEHYREHHVCVVFLERFQVLDISCWQFIFLSHELRIDPFGGRVIDAGHQQLRENPNWSRHAGV